MTYILYNLVLKMTAEMKLLMQSKMTPYIRILKTKMGLLGLVKETGSVIIHILIRVLLQEKVALLPQDPT